MRQCLGALAMMVLSVGCVGPKSGNEQPPTAPTAPTWLPARSIRSETVPQGQAGAPTRADLSWASLDVVELTPAPGTELTANSVVHAKLRYRIAVRPNTDYQILLQFRLADTKASSAFCTNGVMVGNSPSGTVEILCQMNVAAESTAVTSPVGLIFHVAQVFAAGHSASIAKTPTFEYPLRRE